MIEYIFQIEGGETLHFRIDINRKYKEKRGHFWTELGYHQCKNCTLLLKDYRYCPTAIDMEEIIEGFSSFFSHDKVFVRVKTSEREYSKMCDLQTGLQSLLGLVMATSSCPILSKLWALANFHLPFATTEDTLFRAVGAYLIRQYFIFSDKGQPDFDLEGLRNLYRELEELNTSFTERIRIASKTDANLNAVVQLGALSFLVHVSLEEQLGDLRTTFERKKGKISDD
ncbi:hypothetical protein QUF80_21625 [Desulfococcaceae bacterium HSG8]|nr:hypothetical protein [Desulfococcaceae bacterium HSG8]